LQELRDLHVQEASKAQRPVRDTERSRVLAIQCAKLEALA
jgi:hypothetical protein